MQGTTRARAARRSAWLAIAALTFLAPPLSHAVTLGELASGGGTVTSLDGTLTFSNFAFEPVDGALVDLDFSSLEILSTEGGISLGNSYGRPPCDGGYLSNTDCRFVHFDGSYGPGTIDDLLLMFTVEASGSEIAGLGLTGGSWIGSAVAGPFYPDLYPDGPTETTASLDYGSGQLLHARVCQASDCEGAESIDLHASVLPTVELELKVFVHLLTAQMRSDEGYENWGSEAGISSLQVSFARVPEPRVVALWVTIALVLLLRSRRLARGWPARRVQP